MDETVYSRDREYPGHMVPKLITMPLGQFPEEKKASRGRRRQKGHEKQKMRVQLKPERRDRSDIEIEAEKKEESPRRATPKGPDYI